MGEWQKDADHDFNDKVCFRLTGTLPENYATYTTYEYIFHDTMSKGLTFDPSSVEIYLGDEETGTKIDVSILFLPKVVQMTELRLQLNLLI